MSSYEGADGEAQETMRKLAKNKFVPGEGKNSGRMENSRHRQCLGLWVIGLYEDTPGLVNQGEPK